MFIHFIANGISLHSNFKIRPILSEISDFKFRNISFFDQKHKQILQILKASISVPGGLGGCLNAFLSSCVEQLSIVRNIKQVCEGGQLVDIDNVTNCRDVMCSAMVKILQVVLLQL